MTSTETIATTVPTQHRTTEPPATPPGAGPVRPEHTPAARDGVDPIAAAKALEAKARRAARKAARAAAPPPVRDAAFDTFSLADLRASRSSLANEETRVSYWRRIIQARLDVVQSPLPARDPVADLARVLADAQVTRGRVAHLTLHPVDDIPPLPDLAEVWSRQVDRCDAPGTGRLVIDLRRAEGSLSAFRSDLHERIDGLTAELIARYREQPLLALQILPPDPLHRQTLT